MCGVCGVCGMCGVCGVCGLAGTRSPWRANSAAGQPRQAQAGGKVTAIKGRESTAASTPVLVLPGCGNATDAGAAECVSRPGQRMPMIDHTGGGS